MTTLGLLALLDEDLIKEPERIKVKKDECGKKY
jgi:hypothetical protein